MYVHSVVYERQISSTDSTPRLDPALIEVAEVAAEEERREQRRQEELERRRREDRERENAQRVPPSEESALQSLLSFLTGEEDLEVEEHDVTLGLF